MDNNTNICDDENFNKDYWVFMKLITENPDKYLKVEGQILYKIVEHCGVCKNQKTIAKELNITATRISLICKRLECNEIISRIKTNNNGKNVLFDLKLLRQIK